MSAETSETEGKTTAAKAAKTPASKKAASPKSASAKPAAKKHAAKTAAAATATSGAAKKAAPKKAAAKKTPAKTTANAAAKASTTPPSKPTETVGSTKASPEQPEISADPTEDTGAAPSDTGAADPYAAEKLVESLKQKDWKEVLVRGAFMLFFGFAAWFTVMVGLTLSVIQFLIVIVNGSPNEVVRRAIAGIGQYVGEVFDFQSFKSDDRPFPFGRDLPNGD